MSCHFHPKPSLLVMKLKINCARHLQYKVKESGIQYKYVRECDIREQAD